MYVAGANTTFIAALGLWLACLRYAHERGCPWTSACYKYLRLGKPCYLYLEQHGCPRLS